MEIEDRSLSSSQPQSDNNNTAASSFGHRFKQARVSQGLSLQDAADELFILCRHLEAIENEDFKQLPQIAFARGFVINYAKYLKLDPVQMAESFNRAYPEELRQTSVSNVASPLRPMGTLQREGQRSWRINPLLVLGIIGVIALAVILLRVVSNAQDTSEAETVSTIGELSDSEQSEGAALDNTVNTSDNNTNIISTTGNGSAVALDNSNNNSAGASDGTLNNVGSAVNLNNVGSAIELDTGATGTDTAVSTDGVTTQ